MNKQNGDLAQQKNLLWAQQRRGDVIDNLFIWHGKKCNSIFKNDTPEPDFKFVILGRTKVSKKMGTSSLSHASRRPRDVRALW
jgi:hypothetical protein